MDSYDLHMKSFQLNEITTRVEEKRVKIKFISSWMSIKKLIFGWFFEHKARSNWNMNAPLAEIS